MWRETTAIFKSDIIIIHFNPLPPCGGRPAADGRADLMPEISIHSLRVEGDMGRTQNTTIINISIHSLRVEGDSVHRQGLPLFRNFNPLPPCGGRLKYPETTLATTEFQSTPSVWRETRSPCDRMACKGFQSTPSVWRETRLPADAKAGTVISIHSLRVEGDLYTALS